MTQDQSPILEAALGAFLQYGFRRATMGDIAEAAGLSRQSLYARFANKDEVYAAGLEYFAEKMLADLEIAWTKTDDILVRMDALAALIIVPNFETLHAGPHAADLVEGAQTPAGKAVMERLTAQKVALLSKHFAVHAAALETHGLTPDQLADFVETTKHSIVLSAKDRVELDLKIATLKASVAALTKPV